MLKQDIESKVVKARVHVDIPSIYTVTEFVLTTTAPYSEKDDMSRAAFIDCETSDELSHFEFRQQIDQVASGLINNYSLVRGDVIAIYSPNNVNYATVLLAAMSVGVIVTTINPMYTEKEVCHQLEHSNTKLIVTISANFEVSKRAISMTGRNIGIVSLDDCEDAFNSFSSFFCDKPYKKLFFEENESKNTAAVMVYSSGTTGLPKGVVTTHYNLISNIIQTEQVLSEEDRETKYLLGLLPFFHIYGIMLPLLQGIHRHVTIIPMKKFEPILFLKTIEKYRLNFLSLAPPVLLLLAKHPMVDNYDLSSVKRIMCGASPLPMDVAKLVVKRLKCRIEQVYGMTETSPAITMPDSDKVPIDVVGRLLPNISAIIKNPDTNGILYPSETGELWVKGPNTMKGYLNNEKATRQMFDNEGYMRTGDVGFFDQDEYLHIVDRAKELIKYKGYQIAPAELEDALMTHPEVKDCCVIGIHNEAMEELPKAFVVLVDSEENIDERLRNIKAYVHKIVAPYKYLRGGIEQIDSIPKSSTGKILRRILRDEAAKNEKSKSKNVVN